VFFDCYSLIIDLLQVYYVFGTFGGLKVLFISPVICINFYILIGSSPSPNLTSGLQCSTNTCRNCSSALNNFQPLTSMWYDQHEWWNVIQLQFPLSMWHSTCFFFSAVELQTKLNFIRFCHIWTHWHFGLFPSYVPNCSRLCKYNWYL